MKKSKMKKSKKKTKLKIDMSGISRGQKRRELLIFYLMISVVVVFPVILVVLLYRMSEINMLHYFENTLELSAKTSTALVFVIYFLIILLLCFFVFLVIYVLFIRPFYRLSNAIYKVSHDNYDISLPKKSRIGLANRTFNNFSGMCEKLKSVSSMQNDFIAMVSHEIKTPISVINGYAVLLQNNDIPPEKKEHCISQIIGNSAQLSAMAQDLLLLSKLENQKSPEKKAVYSLDGQIRNIILLMEKQWTEKGIRFHLFLEEVNVLANESILYHVWSNILSNAIKFSHVGGAITVTCRLLHKNTVQVEIVDSGCGMNADVQKHIFEKFYQADTSHNSHGNGLGLALTKQIVSMYDGNILVSSAPGEGAAFTVLLRNCLPKRPQTV